MTKRMTTKERVILGFGVNPSSLSDLVVSCSHSALLVHFNNMFSRHVVVFCMSYSSNIFVLIKTKSNFCFDHFCSLVTKSMYISKEVVE